MSDVDHAAAIRSEIYVVRERIRLSSPFAGTTIADTVTLLNDAMKHTDALKTEIDNARELIEIVTVSLDEELERSARLRRERDEARRDLAAEREKVRLLVAAVRELILMGNEATMLLDGEFVSAEHWLRETHGFPDNEGEVTT